MDDKFYPRLFIEPRKVRVSFTNSRHRPIDIYLGKKIRGIKSNDLSYKTIENYGLGDYIVDEEYSSGCLILLKQILSIEKKNYDV